MGFQQPPSHKGYPYGGPYYGYPQQNERRSPEIYRNLNNELASKPINPKLKAGSQAVGSCPSDLHLVTGSDDARKLFQMSRGYSNYQNDFGQQNPDQNLVPRKVLNRIGTFDLADNSGAQPEPAQIYPTARAQYLKSGSLHPDDFQKMEYRAAHMSPSRIKLAPNTNLTPMGNTFFGSGPARPEPSAKPKLKLTPQVEEKMDKKDENPDAM